jgi:hypothetical protein
MNETTGTDRDKPTSADIGRVYLHGTEVRVMLVNDRGVSRSPNDFEVTVKYMEPTDDGEYLVAPVDCRNLTAIGERVKYPNAPDYMNRDQFPNPIEGTTRNQVQINITPEQAALLHSIVRESGWGYTEGGLPELAQELLGLADIIRAAREQSKVLNVKPPYGSQLFDAQFEGVSDRKVILGVD